MPAKASGSEATWTGVGVTIDWDRRILTIDSGVPNWSKVLDELGAELRGEPDAAGRGMVVRIPVAPHFDAKGAVGNSRSTRSGRAARSSHARALPRDGR